MSSMIPAMDQAKVAMALNQGQPKETSPMQFNKGRRGRGQRKGNRLGPQGSVGAGMSMGPSKDMAGYGGFPVYQQEVPGGGAPAFGGSYEWQDDM